MDAVDPDRLLDIAEASALLQVKPGTLYSWVSKNKIPYRKVGSLVRFHRKELMEWTQGVVQTNPRRTNLGVVK